MVSYDSFLGDDPHPRIMRGLLLMGSAKLSVIVDVGSEKEMDCYDPL